MTASVGLRTITLSIELNDIRGDSCDLNDLWVQYELKEQDCLSQSQPYKVGTNEYTFKDLPQTRTTYSYEIKITINDKDVIATFSGTATSECNTTC